MVIVIVPTKVYKDPLRERVIVRSWSLIKCIRRGRGYKKSLGAKVHNHFKQPSSYRQDSKI